MLTLANEPVKNTDQFSDRFKLIIGLIPDASEWLSWAVKTSSNNTYHVDSETSLLRMMMRGLHGNEIVPFHQFKIGLPKVLTMPEADLQQLVSAMGDSKEDGEDLSDLMTRHGLISSDDLKGVDQFLQEIGAHEDKIMTNLSYEDMIALNHFLDSAVNGSTKLKFESTDFALTYANTPSQFIDYFMFYLECARHHIARNTAAALRVRKVTALYHLLEPLTNFLIEVPNVGTSASNKALQEHLGDFIRSQVFVGFETKARAMHNLAVNLNLKDMDNQQLQTDIEKYLLAVKSAAADGQFLPPVVDQVGPGRTVNAQIKNGNIQMYVDAVGNLSLLASTQINFD